MTVTFFLETRIASRCCAQARQISKGEPCINKRYPPCLNLDFAEWGVTRLSPVTKLSLVTELDHRAGVRVSREREQRDHE